MANEATDKKVMTEAEKKVLLESAIGQEQIQTYSKVLPEDAPKAEGPDPKAPSATPPPAQKNGQSDIEETEQIVNAQDTEIPEAEKTTVQD